MGKKFVDPRFARNGEYSAVIQRILEEGHCPFCPDNFSAYHPHPILRKEGRWFITKSGWAYPNAEHHYLVIGEDHKTSYEELIPEDLLQINTLVKWAIDEFELKGGALCHRFGDTNYTGATVCHLHFHLIVPRLEEGKSVPVTFYIG